MEPVGGQESERRQLQARRTVTVLFCPKRLYKPFLHIVQRNISVLYKKNVCSGYAAGWLNLLIGASRPLTGSP